MGFKNKFFVRRVGETMVIQTFSVSGNVTEHNRERKAPYHNIGQGGISGCVET